MIYYVFIFVLYYSIKLIIESVKYSNLVDNFNFSTAINMNSNVEQSKPIMDKYLRSKGCNDLEIDWVELNKCIDELNSAGDEN